MIKSGGISENWNAVTTLAAALCMMILGLKTWLVTRINVNWDEFYFLSHVHALIRGDLAQVMQTSYTHLFTWVRFLPGQEMEQIVAIRYFMVALLILTCVQLWKLAGRWASNPSTLMAPIAYLLATPVLQHGGSFRADSMLAPLTLATLLFVTRERAGHRDFVLGGLCYGLGAALSFKAILLVPVILGVVLARSGPSLAAARPTLEKLVVFALVTGCALALVFAAHSAFVNATGSGVELATAAARKALLGGEFMPRSRFFHAIYAANAVTWWLLLLGGLVAAWRRQWGALACGLALLPILFYRNAFPYYYVVMLAPACVLVAVVCDWSAWSYPIRGRDRLAVAVILGVLALLLAQARPFLFGASQDNQVSQRQIIAAVHEIFPRPVSYIDHGGMIATFPKANFFMSTWGVENYRASGASFMGLAIEQHRPPLLVVNHGILATNGWLAERLSTGDRDLIDQFYVPYWGPIRIAGGRARLSSHHESSIALPFAGRYRLMASAAIRLNGYIVNPGQVIEVLGEPAIVAASTDGPDTQIALVWAAAEPPPSSVPPLDPIYTSL